MDLSLYRDTLRDKAPWWITLALVALLGVLGTLQYRWLGQVADADRARSRAALETAVERFADDFNGELGRLFVTLRGGRLSRRPDDLDAAIRNAWSDWRDTSLYPELVRGIYVTTEDGMRAVGPEEGEEAASPTPELRELERRLAPWLDPESIPERRQDGSFSFLADEVPALVLPYFSGRGRPGPRELLSRGRARTLDAPVLPPARPNPPPRDRRRHRRDPPAPYALLIVHLDRQAIFEDVFPALAERHFGDDFRFHLQVVDAESEAVLFRWGPEPQGGADGSFDAEAQLFGPLLRSFQGDPVRVDRFLGALAAFGHLDEGRWRLRARHPEGSLDVALERVRRRNLAVATGILAVLCAALVLLTRNAARSGRLARQQLDFVAGITHELMTPLAALRSAGQNLADGVVAEGPQVARYGRMIDREGRRLTELVGQVLAFARMQSGTRFEPEPLDAAGVVRQVVEELRPQLEAADVKLDLDVGDPLPPVLADRQGLVRALANLLGNGIKYGIVDDRRLRLGCGRRGSEVVFEVQDFGPGIPPAERSAIFEPFYRGGGKAASAVPGTGLGLALVKYLVEAQGGRVGLTSKLGQGSTFRLALPVAERPPREPFDELFPEEPTP